MRSIDRISSQNLFPRMKMANTRGHNYTVREGRFNGDMQENFNFTQRVVRAWNALPGAVVGATIATFKR